MQEHARAFLIESNIIADLLPHKHKCGAKKNLHNSVYLQIKIVICQSKYNATLNSIIKNQASKQMLNCSRKNKALKICSPLDVVLFHKYFLAIMLIHFFYKAIKAE
ncbi:hypothetical protein [Bartonella senegalensis]|uniref:hypothetical protein n=1 Tax=Bartonella senegalensis TaxID=1468418 RepID=UPI00055C49AF|nr:hypothetical protein [Bartonella senegalensis]